MTRFTRIISLALAAFLTLTALVTVTNATQFTDVPSTAPLLDAINYAVDNNFIEPTSSTTFSPNSYMTRGNMVLMLYRHSGETASSTNTGFTDVPSSSVYARAVVWAVAKGITNGTSNTTFEPNTNIKRQDAAVFMYRYAQYMVHRTDYTSTLEDFTDSGRVQSYALPAMQWAVGAGIISGTTSTTLEPRVALKRGAAAAMLQRYGFSVEGINFDRDVYGFLNNGSFFYSDFIGRRYINNSDYSLLQNYCTALGVTSSQLSSLYEYINSKWSGSCFGMCLTILFDKMGHVDVNNRVPGSSILPELSGNDLDLESYINYHHFLQLFRGFTYCDEADLMDTVDNLAEEVEQRGVCLIGIRFPTTDENGKTITVGHAMIAHRVERTDLAYKIYVYDPNTFSSESYILVANIGAIDICTYFEKDENNEDANSYIIKQIRYGNWNDTLEEFSDFDIDGPYNSDTYEYQTTAESTFIPVADAAIFNFVSDTKNTLYIKCNSDFEITNNIGESLNYNVSSNEISGDMIVHRHAISDLGVVEPLYILTVDKSSQYTIKASSESTDFLVLTSTNLIGAVDTNHESVTITENGIINVVGQSVSFNTIGNVTVKTTPSAKAEY